MLWRASIAGALLLILGRVFGFAREFMLAREVGPTAEMASYVLASTVLLAVAGLVSGVASALVIRNSGSVKTIGVIGFVASGLPLVGVTFMLWLSDQGSAIVFLLFALSVPMYAIYGVANGRLMRAGRSFLGMLASAIPAFLSFVFLALPIGNFLERAAWGNLVGAIVMAFVTSQFSRHILDQSPVVPVGKVVVQAIAIFAVSAINIASPIIDRFFANAFGPEELVLLNLGAILYIGAVTSLGMAMGNAAVSRASVNGNEFSTGAITTIPLIVGAAFFGVTPIFVSMVLAGGGYGENGSGVLTAVCFVYAISTPCAILNQVYMRLWNRVAPARSMIVIAVLLLVLNVAGNWFFVLKFGVVGIAVSTLFVQVIQSIVLGVLRKNRTPVLMVVLCTTVAGGVLIATS